MEQQVTYFNRHENMNSETRFMILDLIKELSYKCECNTFTLENYLYGFFDGYNYSRIIPAMNVMEEIEKESPSTYKKVMEICRIVQSYPATKEPNNNNF